MPRCNTSASSKTVSPDCDKIRWDTVRFEAHAHENRTASTYDFDADKIYTLADLVELAQQHNPETQVSWQNAKAQAAARVLGENLPAFKDAAAS